MAAILFSTITLVDFEFRQPDGHLPEPHCMVAMDYRTGAVTRVWADELGRMPAAPFPTDAESLVVAYYASAEWSCFQQLGWELPVNILDLFTEFRCLANGRSVPCGFGLLGALAYYGLDAMAGAAKDLMRELAIRGGPFTDRERQDLLTYCEADVQSLSQLLSKMLPTIDWPRALLRGRYTSAVGRMERVGVPIDADTLGRLKAHWEPICARLIEAVDADYEVYVPTGRAINSDSTLGAAILATAGLATWTRPTYAHRSNPTDHEHDVAFVGGVRGVLLSWSSHRERRCQILAGALSDLIGFEKEEISHERIFQFSTTSFQSRLGVAFASQAFASPS